ncbi:MAG: hypothetical protein J5849_03720, partial [Clostridia bacterium]|nr:hypothetical protein [Clostridia bacterium]
LGIVLGTKGIPADWKDYIGDRIIPICISASYRDFAPKTCTELTELVLDTLPDVLKAYDIEVLFTDGESDVREAREAGILKGYKEEVFRRSRLSFEIPSRLHTDAVVEYEADPVVKPGEDFTLTVTLTNRRRNPYHYEVTVGLPEGWTADYPRTQYVEHKTLVNDGTSRWTMTVHAGDRVDPVNRIPVVFTPRGHAVPVMIPVVLLG